MNKAHTRITLLSGSDKVFQALTKSEELTKWFSEYAEVSILEKNYSFWGRYTPEAPGQNSCKHKILSCIPNQSLKFEWVISDTPTTVEFQLNEIDHNTLLEVTHLGLPTWKIGETSLSDFWDLSIENLRGWIESNQQGYFYDFSKGSHGEIRHEINIRCDAASTFEALVNPITLNRYIATQATVENKVGGKYSFGWEGGEGPIQIKELVPNEKLSYLWRHDHNSLVTVVTWDIRNQDIDSITLKLLHSGFAPDQKVCDYGVGWLDFMIRLKHLLEFGENWQKAITSTYNYTQTDSAPTLTGAK